MPEETIPKYVVECQICQESLSIIYSDSKKDDEKSRTHLARMMKYHLKLEGHDDVDFPTIKEKWVQRIRPVKQLRSLDEQWKAGHYRLDKAKTGITLEIKETPRKA